MLDSMNVRTMYRDQHEEIWLRGKETLVSAQLSDSHSHQKPGKPAYQYYKGLKLKVIFILINLIYQLFSLTNLLIV